MGKKYFVWSFDDGLEQDKKIIEILKDCNMGATFNLNSGLFGRRQMIGRISNLGFKEVPVENYNKKRSILKYGPDYRIAEDEVAQVYEGFEIASHTLHHMNLTKISTEEAQKEVFEDVMSLSDKFQQEVVGFAYPYGANSEGTKAILQKCGISYARTTTFARDFHFPKDPLELPLTGWHIKKNTMDLVEQFVHTEETAEDQFFLMFAHGYELDFNTKESNWNKFRRICDMVASHDEIICCSTKDALANKKCIQQK